MPLLSPTRILKLATQKPTTPPTKWSETLSLPRSAFPARPTSAQLGEYRKRCADDLYAWQRVHRPATISDDSSGKKKKEVSNEFILHDGPPYANGAVHIGHALNKVLKDLIVRWDFTRGRRVHYRPGWDCHGLPIELKALQAQRTGTQQAGALEDKPGQEAAAASAAASSGKGMSASEIRSVAKELASRTVENQMESFRAWGVMGEWERPYKTMDREFEIKQLGVFKEMVRKGLISRHHRPVYWSPSSRTALAEAELEYDDHHKCTAAFVKMPFVRLPRALESNSKLNQLQPSQLNALIWTTTPWTLPANRAIAVHPEMEYVVVSLSRSSVEELLLVAKERIDHIASFLPNDTRVTTIVDAVYGRELSHGQATCLNLFQNAESPILEASFVTATSGTGLVHMAPAHGMEDYQVCRGNNINSALSPVDDEGRFTAEAFSAGGHNSLLKGLDAQTQGANTVLEILRNADNFKPSDSKAVYGDLVLASHTFTHKNPIDWRTKLPVIVRATAQWFADVSATEERALSAIEDVKFIPEEGRARLRSFVAGRSEWCISRQRPWGVPIPALYHIETGEACITETSIDHIIATIKERGTDAWYSDPPDERAWIHSSLELDTWTRGKDTMDVWFDSGTTWTTLNGKRADVYVEGTDQHRGWFQSSLLTSVATQNTAGKAVAPYETLITHGFTLDAEGRKMSKSLGNVISPDQILDGSLLPPIKAKKQRGKAKESSGKTDETKYDAMGPDVLRLWVASSDYTRDISISIPGLQNVQQALQKYRVTFKFLLGVLSDYNPSKSLDRKAGNTPFANRAVLSRLAKTSQESFQAYKEYRFYKIVTEMNTFVNADLSAFYFEVIKDAMYAGGEDVRKSTQDVLATILWEMLRILGPITPHLVEEVWEFMPPGLKSDGQGAEVLHPLKRIWSEPYRADEFTTGDEEQELEMYKRLSDAVKVAQEEARQANKLGSGLGCKVEVILDETTPASFAKCVKEWERSGELADLLVVSQASVTAEQRRGETQAEWAYEQPIDFGSDSADARARVVVTPPEHHKCVRCWKYTATEADVPCERCRDVLKERRQDFVS